MWIPPLICSYENLHWAQSRQQMMQSFFVWTTEIDQGPIVQSIISLASLLMTNSLNVVAKVFSNTLIFLLQKYE